MAFTDRYMRMPVSMHNRKEAELTGNSTAGAFEAYAKINPMEIVSYHTEFDEEAKPMEATVLWFKSGESIIVGWTIPEFERRVNEFMK